MDRVLQLSLSIALSIALPAWIVRRDLRRLRGDALARAWNDASLWSAVVAFGPVCLLVHFARTRRTLRGAALGLLWTLAALSVPALLGWAFDA